MSAVYRGVMALAPEAATRVSVFSGFFTRAFIG